jgi:hypothetical protein
MRESYEEAYEWATHCCTHVNPVQSFSQKIAARFRCLVVGSRSKLNATISAALFGGELIMSNHFIVAASVLCVMFGCTFARATVLTFDRSGTANFPDTKMWVAPASGGFADYGDNVVGASQTAVGPGAAYTYSYGTAGGSTPGITASYPGTNRPYGGTGANDEGTYVTNNEGGSNQGPVASGYYADDAGVNPLAPYGALHGIITLTADPFDRYTVSLQKFDLGTYTDDPVSVQYLRVYRLDDNTTLWSAGNLNTTPGPAPTGYFTIGTGYTSVPITYDFTNGSLIPAAPHGLTGRQLTIEVQTYGAGFQYSLAFDNIQFAQTPEPTGLTLLLGGSLFILPRRRPQQ